jgi:hypothetical protein
VAVLCALLRAYQIKRLLGEPVSINTDWLSIAIQILPNKSSGTSDGTSSTTNMAKVTSDIMEFFGNAADTAAKRGKDFYQERQPPPITEDDEKRANEALLDPRRLVPVTPLLIKDTDHALCKAPLTRQEAAVTYSYVESGKNTAAARLKVAFEWNVKGSAFRIAVRDPAELAGQYFTTTSSKLLGYIPEGKDEYGPTHAKSLTSDPMHEDTVRESDTVSRKVSTGRRVRLVEKSLLNDIDLWVVHEDGSIQRKDDFDSGRKTAGFWGTGAKGNKHKDKHPSKWTFGEVMVGHKHSSKMPSTFDEISTSATAFKGHVVKKSQDLARNMLWPSRRRRRTKQRRKRRTSCSVAANQRISS